MAAPMANLVFRNPGAHIRLFRIIASSKLNVSSTRTKYTHRKLVELQTTKRCFCLCSILHANELSKPEVKRLIDNLTDNFSEARELLDDARQSRDTVYFSDDMEEAKGAVKDTLDEYKNLLDKLSDGQREDVIRTLGLKMEELKAQLNAIEEELKE